VTRLMCAMRIQASALAMDFSQSFDRRRYRFSQAKVTDEKLDALLEAVAENTTTLIDVQKQAAATSASAKDSRTYVQNIAKQTDWVTNGKAIASVLTAAMEKDHTALHAASKAAQEMRSMSVEIAHKANVAAESQKDASERFHSAANRFLELKEAREVGSGAEWAQSPS
jgi:hypothetical protein